MTHNSLGVAHLQYWKSPVEVHLGACVSPIFTAPICLSVGLGDVPMRDGFGYPILGDKSTPSDTLPSALLPPTITQLKCSEGVAQPARIAHNDMSVFLRICMLWRICLG